MTEQQITQFKDLLEKSSLARDLEQTSNDLDMKILSAAQARDASQVKTPSLSMFGLPLSVVGMVSLAILFTVGLFFGMSQMIVPDEQEIVVKSSSEKSVGRLVVSDTKVKNLVERPELAAQQDAPSKISRDKILMDFDLPATNKLLAQMEFSFERDPTHSQVAIELAMFEINAMIELGTFDSARERYAMLLENCEDCGLPTTLEALVLSVAPQTG